MPRILVVDDDTIVLTAVQVLLVRQGYEVMAVDQGDQAALALGRGGFDAVVVDLFMPGMDGYQAIQEFQRLDPGIPVVAMSGIVFRAFSGGRAPDFLGMAGKMGATRSLHKPFNPEELMEAVQACVEARTQQSETIAKRA